MCLEKMMKKIEILIERILELEQELQQFSEESFTEIMPSDLNLLLDENQQYYWQWRSLESGDKFDSKKQALSDFILTVIADRDCLLVLQYGSSSKLDKLLGREQENQ